MGPEQAGWNCVDWIKEGLDALASTGALGTSIIDWQTVRDATISYVEKKKAQHRFDGQAATRRFDSSKVPTYNLLDKSEIIE